MRVHKLLLYVLIAFFGGKVFANSIIISSNEEFDLRLSTVKFWVDSSNANFDEVLENKDNFKYADQLSYTPEQALWGTLKLDKFSSNINATWFIEFMDSKIDEIELYQVKPNKEVAISYGGDKTHNFNDREILYNNSCFPVTLSDDYETIIYFKIKSDKKYFLNIKLAPHTNFIESAVTKYHILGIFFGAIIVIFLLVTGQIVVYKQFDLTIFLLFLVGVVLLFLTYDNFGFHYFWTSYPFINEKGFGMSMLIFILMQFLFVRRFLDANYISSMLDNIIIILMLCRVLIYTASNFVTIPFLRELSIDVLTLSVMLAVAIGMYIKKHDLARFVVLALAVQIITFSLIELCQKGMIDYPLILDYGFQFGTTLAVLFYSMAILDKIRFSNVFIVDENQDIAEDNK